MKPREFVGRVLDLFEFNCSPINPKMKARSFFNAVTLMRSTGHPTRDFRVVVDGYLFVLQTEDALRHTILQATMLPGGNMETAIGNMPLSASGIRASLCWNVKNNNEVLETFELPPKYRYGDDEIIGLIGYLTLKTRYIAKDVLEVL